MTDGHRRTTAGFYRCIMFTCAPVVNSALSNGRGMQPEGIMHTQTLATPLCGSQPHLRKSRRLANVKFPSRESIDALCYAQLLCSGRCGAAAGWLRRQQPQATCSTTAMWEQLESSGKPRGKNCDSESRSSSKAHTSAGVGGAELSCLAQDLLRGLLEVAP